MLSQTTLAVALLLPGSVQQESYRFVLDTQPMVGVLSTPFGPKYPRLSFGRLDAAGNFHPERRWFQVTPDFPQGNPTTNVINRPPGPAYEYRSGRLILGDLDQAGNFVPRAGSTIIPLADYLDTYQPEKSIRIYNLPGRLDKKAQAP